MKKPKEELKKPDFLDKYLKKALTPVEGDSFHAYITAPPMGCSEDDASLLAWWDRPSNPHKALRQQVFDLVVSMPRYGCPRLPRNGYCCLQGPTSA